VDGNGNAYIGGTTSSEDFPTANAFQSTNPSLTDEVFITKMSPTGSSLVYSTYLGGDGNDSCSAIAVDAAGSAYVAGTTLSQNFPIVGAFQPALRGFDAFITKLAPGGSSLVYSTFLGGFSDDSAFGLALDQS